MKNKSKSFGIVLASLVALVGVLAALFFAREIITGLNKINSLREEAGRAGASVVPFLDTIENDLNQNNNTFQFISVEKDKKDESLIVFSGKSYGTFAEALRAFQILEREVYPIEITKAILGKDVNNIQFGGAWSASFQANIGAIPGIIKSEPKEE